MSIDTMANVLVGVLLVIVIMIFAYHLSNERPLAVSTYAACSALNAW